MMKIAKLFTGEMFLGIALVLIALAMAISVLLNSIAPSSSVFPANIRHDAPASAKIELCVNASVGITAIGGQSSGNGQVWPATTVETVNADYLIECLYAVGITLEDNGEPIRMESE